MGLLRFELRAGVTAETDGDPHGFDEDPFELAVALGDRPSLI
jgi:hypothetical protein